MLIEKAHRSRKILTGLGVLMTLLFTKSANSALTFNSLISFNNTDGESPQSLIIDGAGNLYGTTSLGGTGGEGIAFELASSAPQTVITLASFDGGSDGALPAGLMFDAAGNLLGTTSAGGANRSGTIFKLYGNNHQSFSTVYAFPGTEGGVNSATFGTDGNLYGTSNHGGLSNDGTVYELNGPNFQTLTNLVTFTGLNGYSPSGTVISDATGNLYGTTFYGGSTYGSNVGYGEVFKLSGANHQTLTTLHSFNNGAGANPAGPLTFDSSGNLYGTTEHGGAYGDGTVFELSGPNYQTFTTLVNFYGGNGEYPVAGVIVDGAGNLYGTTTGTNGTSNEGTVFELSGTGHNTLTTLVKFNGSNGNFPTAGLTPDALGDLYGTTEIGGDNGDGTVFEITGSGFVVVPEPIASSLLMIIGLALLSRRTSRSATIPRLVALL